MCIRDRLNHDLLQDPKYPDEVVFLYSDGSGTYVDISICQISSPYQSRAVILLFEKVIGPDIADILAFCPFD